MATNDVDGLDAPACPLLGLRADRRSRFTFPHQGHRCFATGDPWSIDAGRQTTFCLSLDFAVCDRYRAWQDVAATAAGPGSHPAADPGTTVIHVFRTGDSLARIAARYGLTVEQLADVNGLARNVAVTDGARLVIPLERRSPDEPRGRPSRPRTDGSV